MSDLPSPSEQTHDVEVDLAAFLPDGVELAGPDEAAPDEVVAGEVVAGEVVADDASVDPDAIERDLDAVDAAIAALDDGTYGIDAASGEAIADERLAADPVSFR